MTAHCCACIGCYDPQDGDPHHADGIELCPKHKQRNPPPKPPSPIERRWGYRVSPMERFPGWYIQINDGPSVYGPYPSGLFSCWGSRDRAVRKAKRIIARQQAKQARSEALTVTSEEA